MGGTAGADRRSAEERNHRPRAEAGVHPGRYAVGQGGRTSLLGVHGLTRSIR